MGSGENVIDLVFEQGSVRTEVGNRSGFCGVHAPMTLTEKRERESPTSSRGVRDWGSYGDGFENVDDRGDYDEGDRGPSEGGGLGTLPDVP